MDAKTQYLNPAVKVGYLSVQHVERYRFAEARLDGSIRALDIASGPGYGTRMLGTKGRVVVGVDYDFRALGEAKRSLRSGAFVNADALELPFADASFDAVVSFETIEHVEDGSAFLSEMLRVLRPGGTFICSTPNRSYTSHPVYHVREYEPSEFFSLVEEHFSRVERFGQYMRRADRLCDIYTWKIRNPMVMLLDRLGIKDHVKGFFRGEDCRPAGAGVGAYAPPPVADRDCFYEVGRLNGEGREGGGGLLRIMLACAIR